MAVNLHPSSWRSTSIHPRGGQPSLLTAVKPHPGQSTSNLPCDQPPTLLAVNFPLLEVFLGLRGKEGIYSIGWSELALFAIFENRHYAADQEYFYVSNPNHFQQITEAVK